MSSIAWLAICLASFLAGGFFVFFGMCLCRAADEEQGPIESEWRRHELWKDEF